MMGYEAPAKALGQVPETQPASVMQEGMELRILTGCHQGASLSIALGQLLRVGSDDDCDVLLSDCGLAEGASVQVVWEPKGWSVLSMAADHDAAPAQSHALGAVAQLGQVSATICAEHLPWQTLAQPLSPPCAVVQEDEAPSPATAPGSDDVDSLHACAAPESETESEEHALTAQSFAKQAMHRLLGGGMRTSVPALACAVAVVMLCGAWAVWRYVPVSAQADALMSTPTKVPAGAALSPQAQDKAVKEARLAMALVEPSLRMHITPNVQGGVTVSGWVDTVEQFDRLAQALSSLRPLPRLAVRTSSEVLDALSDAGSMQGVNLQFSLIGSGKVQAKGMVATPAQQELVLAQLRARAPQGIEIVDGLRVASLQGPAVKRWLGAQGLSATQADWDGEQLVLAVELSARQRPQLERLLASDQTPLSGVPFLLQTRTVADAAERKRLDAGAAGLPFRIRSVVGGAAPYVVLADGAKLQPGGGRAGWCLTSIAQDHLVFDGPKRLEISR